MACGGVTESLWRDDVVLMEAGTREARVLEGRNESGEARTGMWLAQGNSTTIKSLFNIFPPQTLLLV